MQNKLILITGASSGIGRACATALAAQGHHVYGTSRRPIAAPPDVTLLPMDVTDTESVDAAVQTVLERERRLDVLIANAGIGFGGTVEESTLEEVQALFDVNFFGVVRVCRAVLPIMRAQGAGRIIAIGSIGGRMGLPFQAPYSASKYALEGFIESLRLEIAGLGIHAILVEPGDVSTALTANRLHAAAAANTASPYAARYQRAIAKIEFDESHGVTPEHIARTVLHAVASRRPRMRYVTGPVPQQVAAWIKPYLPPTVFEHVLLAYYGLS